MTEYEKLDLIWKRCKDNMSSIENLDQEWIDISKKVAENNADTDCPLFKAYLSHLEHEDKLIYLDTSEGKDIYRATVKGLIFQGYHQIQLDKALERERLKIENTRNKRVNCLLVVGSILGGIGAIALVVWEVYKAFYLHSFN